MGFKYNNELYHVAHTFWGADADKGWLFTFGAYGGTRVIVLSEPGTSSLDDALEAAAEVVADVAPGIFTEPEYDDPDLDSPEDAETDLTYTESGWIPSWEWTVNDLYSDSPRFKQAVEHAIKTEDDY